MSNKELSLEEIVEIKKNIVQSIMEDLNLPELTGREYGHIESEIDKSVNSGLYDLWRRIEEQIGRRSEEIFELLSFIKLSINLPEVNSTKVVNEKINEYLKSNVIND